MLYVSFVAFLCLHDYFSKGKMTIQAIIFDMDGLLVDSEPVWNDARAAMAARYGKPWTQADHFNVMGVSTEEWVAYMIDRLGLSLNPDNVQAEVLDQMAALYRQQIPFRPYAVEAVQWAAAHYPTALASGSPRHLIDIVTQSPEMNGRFQVVLAADEVGKGKPDPAIYLETARRLGVAPAHCVCLEDSANGVLSGHRAGMKVINVPDLRYPLTAVQAGFADLVLDSLADFTAVTLQTL